MPTFNLTVSAIELKVLQHVIYDLQRWLDNSIENRARHAADWCILKYTDKNPHQLTDLEKRDIIQDLTLPPHPGTEPTYPP